MFESVPESGSQVGDQTGEYSKFQSLTADHWTQWLKAFLADDPIEPTIAVVEESLHQILIRIFNNLTPKASMTFKRAVFNVFEDTPITESNARQLYTLLHMIAYAPPSEAKQLLRRRLREGVFNGLFYGGQSLHGMLLVACSKYHVDPELAKWVQKSARSSDDFDYLLLCQRVLATTGDRKAFYFIERLLQHMDSPEKAAASTRQMHSISERLGYSGFLSWYRARSLDLQSTYKERWALYIDTLRERLFSDSLLPVLASKDPDAAILYSELRISRNHIPLKTVLQIARLEQHLDPEETVEILMAIWTDLFDRSGEVPWNYLAAQEKRGMAVQSGLGTIFREVRNMPLLQENFMVADEPGTEHVLIEVRKRYEPMLPPLVKAAGGGRR